jgi:hypothetical protein
MQWVNCIHKQSFLQIIEAGLDHPKEVVASGHFPLYRDNPDLAAKGENPLKLDSTPSTMSFSEQAILIVKAIARTGYER